MPPVVVARPPRGGARREEEELEGWWRAGQLKTAHQPTGGATLSPELKKNCSKPQYFQFRAEVKIKIDSN